ncbi:MAG TPA: choice-of-anchor V domain-containing protein, partial [Bacteroidia bacterium]|nr:choice-of-anchor V domain-containing protein [Bacteroidia bacterium]
FGDSVLFSITATATRANHIKFGFEISPQSPTGTYLGTMIDTSTQTQIVSTKYITHTSTGTTGTNGFHTWAFNWTAPAIGTGNVTFYGAFNVTNSSNSSVGDTIYLSTLLISECVRPAQPSTITRSTTVCAGSTQTYSVTNDSSANGYIWTLPLGWAGTSTTNSITVTVGTSSGTISVVAFNNTCGNSTARTLNVTVNNVAVGTSQTNVLCFRGNTGSATANPSGGSSPYSYLWSNSSSSQTASNLSAGTYTVTVTDNIGCTKTSSVTITQPATPLGGTTGGNPSMCFGDSVLFSITATGGTPPYTYLWIPSTGLSSTTISNPFASPPATTTYTCVVTDNNGCTVSTSLTVTVNPLPVAPNITQNFDTLFANPTGQFPIWYLNGSPVVPQPPLPGDYLVTNVQGIYTLRVYSIEGCLSAPSTPYPYFPTTISENISSDKIILNPNPASSQITVSIPAEWKNSPMIIYNIIGNIVRRSNLTESHNNIDITLLNDGIYFASVQKNARKIMVRFAVVK